MQEMWCSRLEPNVLSYLADMSACEKRLQWDQVWTCCGLCGAHELSRISYNAAMSACEKRLRWEQALDLLQEMGRSRLEPFVISSNAATIACDKRF